MSGDLLLVTGAPGGDGLVAVARTAGSELELRAAAVNYSREDGESSQIAILWFPEGGRISPPDSIVLTADGTETIDRDALVTGELALEQFLADQLVGGDLPSRTAMLAGLFGLAHSLLERPGGHTLAMRLRTLRDALRDPLQSLDGADSAQAVSLELIMAVDEQSFWIVGWVHDRDQSFRELIALTPEGQRADLLGSAYRHRRHDVEESWGRTPSEKHGFVTYLRLPHPSPLDTGWLIEVHRADGVAFEISAPPVIRDPTHVRNRVLDEFARERSEAERLRLEHAHPALVRLQEEHRMTVEIEDVVHHGTPPDAPLVSIVVPLYRRIDLIEHQLTHFGQDPQLARADLLYVLDSPELAAELEPLAAELHALHGVPFRLVKLARNSGFSAANNVGVSQSRAPLVLLLNSDVIPVRAGWLERMASFYDSTPDIGALGPKLLFEDLSIQHAGMYFRRERRTSLWGNMHYFKGFHRDFADACVNRPVPAVTGACMMVERNLYEEVGGLSDLYVQGGYEDSDFCIRVSERGRRNWYLADVELYHLEAQSFPSPARHLTTFYNMWLQTHLWDETIERLMREQEALELASTGELALPSRLSSA